MRNLICLLLFAMATKSHALNSTHFTITRISAPYFIVDGNSPATINKAYVGFEIKNNSNSGVTYSGLRFVITSIGSSVAGQNYSIIAPASGQSNIGTLAPGESKVCYFYVAYPASTTAQASFNIQLSDNTAGVKTQSITIFNRSSISANAGGTATQSFTNQDLIGGLIFDDVTYVVGNVKNGDESDFQVAVSPQFDPTKITLLGTEVLSSNVPGINTGATDSLYFITGSGSNGSSITIRWTFRITGINFTNYLLPCAGATSGGSNYKYALNTTLGSGSPVTISASANPLTITKTSDQAMYGVNKTATFTVTINNPGAYGITIDRIMDEIPAGFVFQALDGSSQVKAINSTSVPQTGATGSISFEGGVSSGANTSYFVPANGSLMLRYTATTPNASVTNLQTTAKGFVAATEIGAAQNIVGVSSTLPHTLYYFNAAWMGQSHAKLDWKIINEFSGDRFEIERSFGDNSFIVIGKLNSTGVTGMPQVYSFIDSLPGSVINKYRLKLIGRDNITKYSPVVLLNRQQKGWDLVKLFPVPFTSDFNLQLVSGSKINVEAALFNIMGSLVFRTRLNCAEGTNTIRLANLEHLGPGLYTLRVTDGNKVLQQTILKQ